MIKGRRGLGRLEGSDIRGIRKVLGRLGGWVGEEDKEEERGIRL